MLRKTSCLLALVLLCGVGQAGVSMADGAYFIGHLPQGTVELVGITNCRPTNQSRWWQPDGPAAPLGPFRPQRTHFPVYADKKALTFLVRFENLPADASAPSSAKNLPADASRPAKNLPADASWPAWGINNIVPPSAPWWEGDYVVDAHGKIVPSCKMFSASLGASAQTADFRVGISMGAWETVISQKPDSVGRRTFSRDGQQWTVTFHKATAGASADTTQVRLTTTLRWPESYGKLTKRLVAVASDGSEHAPSIDSVKDSGNGVAVFQDLPLSSIKEFRFQVRPYYWVEFENVSLQSGQKRYVTVVSSDDSVNTEK